MSFSLSQTHVLVWAEESHEFWSSNDINHTCLVNIEMSPGLSEVSCEIFIGSSSSKSLMGGKNLFSSRSSNGLIHEELSVGWIILVLSFEGIVGNHWSHEDIIWISGESSRDNSLVFIVSSSVFVGTKELNVFFIWWIGVWFWVQLEEVGIFFLVTIGALDWVVAIGLLDLGVSSVILNGSERPNWLIFKSEWISLGKTE